jgi:hypothetical protein
MQRILLTVLFCLLFSAAIPADSAETLLLDKELIVPRSGFKEVHFLVPENGVYEFQGSFRSTGGFHDEVILMICTQEDYVRWFSKRPYKVAMMADRKTEGGFRVKGKNGETYYFVLDNFFSTVSNKKVKLLIKLVEMDSDAPGR